MSPRFLTKVKKYIPGNKHGRSIYFCRKMNPRDHEKISLTRFFFLQENLLFLTKFLYVHIANCNKVIDTYLPKQKSMIYKICVKR